MEHCFTYFKILSSNHVRLRLFIAEWICLSTDKWNFLLFSGFAYPLNGTDDFQLPNGGKDGIELLRIIDVNDEFAVGDHIRRLDLGKADVDIK